MKGAIALLVLSNLLIATTASAMDAKEVLRYQSTFCNQFIIHDPDPRGVLNQMRPCCAFSQNIRDCRMHDWGAIERW
jgi:hypothetical protein